MRIEVDFGMLLPGALDQDVEIRLICSRFWHVIAGRLALGRKRWVDLRVARCIKWSHSMQSKVVFGILLPGALDQDVGTGVI